MRELDYVPDAIASSLALRRSRMLLARLAGEAVGNRRLDLGHELVIRESA